MDRMEDIVTEEESTPKEREKIEGQELGSQDSNVSDEKEITEGDAQAEKESKDSDEPAHDTDKIKDAIEKNKDVINIFNIFRNDLKINNTNNGIITGNDASFQDVFFGTGERERRQDLEEGIADKPEQLEQWITNHYGQSDVAFLIACAVFHDMPYSWINEASEALYFYFDENEKTNIGATARALNVRTFGAEICQGTMPTYTGKIEVDCIRFSKEKQVNTILEVIWNEFPHLREILVLWLKEYVLEEKKAMSGRARDILGYLSGLDYYYFSHKMIGLVIQQNSINNDLILVQIIEVLYQKPQYAGNIDYMLKSWSKSQNVHYLLTTMLVCVIVAERNDYLENAVHTYINLLFASIQRGIRNAFYRNRLSFFAAGMRKVIFYRMVIEDLYEMGRQNNSVQTSYDVCALFFELFRADVILSDFEKEVEDEAIFIKLVSMKSSFRDKLCFLWNMIWQKNRYRMSLYDLLGQYFALMPQQGREQKISFFVNAALQCKYSKQTCDDFVKKIVMRVQKYET